MLYGLVTVGVVAHIHNLHLTDLVDDEAIVAVIEDGWEGEDAVKLASKSLIPAHEINESLHVMKDGPAIVERITFSEGISPLVDGERGLEGAILPAPAHPADAGIVELAVVHRSLGVELLLVS